jgi:hypothetical protein
LPLDEREGTLAGLENSVTAMIDDILGLYPSSQLMIANDTKTAPVFITLNAFQIGEGRYIIAITVFNAFLILVVIVEAIRTRGWKTLVDFNYMDPRYLVIGSSRGGQELAKAVLVQTTDRAYLAQKFKDAVTFNHSEWLADCFRARLEEHRYWCLFQYLKYNI